jgi:hypothetical protein
VTGEEGVRWTPGGDPSDVGNPPDQLAAPPTIPSAAGRERAQATDVLAARADGSQEQGSSTDSVDKSSQSLASLESDRFVPETIGAPSLVADAPWKLAHVVAQAPVDTILDGGETDAVVLRAASCRGISHRLESEVRQDSIAVSTDPSGRWLAAAVADGVGSSARSHLGSLIAAESAVRILLGLVSRSEEVDPRVVMASVAWEMRLSADQASPGANGLDREIASTLCIALIDTTSDHGESGSRAQLWRVGDSTAAQLRAGEWDFLFTDTCDEEAEGALLDSSTRSLPSDWDRIESDECVVTPSSPLFLMTDGVSLPLAGARQVRDYLAACWAQAPYPLAFLGQMEFRRRTFTDDRSVIGIWSKSS